MDTNVPTMPRKARPKNEDDDDDAASTTSTTTSTSTTTALAKYTKLEEIGRGSFAKVYQGIHNVSAPFCVFARIIIPSPWRVYITYSERPVKSSYSQPQVCRSIFRLKTFLCSTPSHTGLMWQLKPSRRLS